MGCIDASSPASFEICELQAEGLFYNNYEIIRGYDVRLLRQTW